MRHQTLILSEGEKEKNKQSLKLWRILDRHRSLSSSKIVRVAKEDYGVFLPIQNGRSWLKAKIGYLAIQNIRGLNEVETVKSMCMDLPETIAEYQEWDGQQSNQGERAMSKAKDGNEVVAKKGKGRDEFGWVNGSKSGARWAMLMKGATKEDVIKELGSGLSAWWRGITMDMGACTFSRAAKMVTKYIKATGKIKYFIGEYTLPDGTEHTNPKAPEKSTLPPVKKKKVAAKEVAKETPVKGPVKKKVVAKKVKKKVV